jgi:hypothetical protein
MKENFHMQSWAKRGLQTALVTGGLLMLGTGIACADENIDPDIPASLLDLNVTVPYTIADNALGTPVGQSDLGGATGEISTKPATKAVKEAISSGVTPARDAVKGNKVSGDVVVPIQITCNAIGVVGDASVADCRSSQSYSHNHDVATSGKNSGIAGNGVVLDWAAPIQITGNAGGLAGGSGYATGSASEYDADTSATPGGWIQTNGAGGAGTGNVVGAPIALPIKVNCNAGGAWGSDADTGTRNTSADAQSGNTTPGGHDTRSYIQTGGDKPFIGGDIIAPQGGLIANVAGVAGSWIGNSSTSGGSSSSTVDSGGSVIGQGDGKASSDTTSTARDDTHATGPFGAIAGNLIQTPVSLPVQGHGVGGSVIGIGTGASDNLTDSTAGGNASTNGHGGAGTGNILGVDALPIAQVFGDAAGVGGIAHAIGDNQATGTASGVATSAGDEASLSGFTLQQPVGALVSLYAAPLELFGGVSAEATAATAVQPQVLANLPVTMPEQRANDLPTLPTADGGQPTTLPADVSGLLPALPGARQNATPEAQVPALAQLEGGPLSMFSNLVADLAGKKYHIQ